MANYTPGFDSQDANNTVRFGAAFAKIKLNNDISDQVYLRDGMNQELAANTNYGDKWLSGQSSGLTSPRRP